jgi:hypothetical protein
VKDLEATLTDFGTMKRLMGAANKDTPRWRKRNVMVEFADGTHGLAHMHVDADGPIPRLAEAKRVTFFVDGKEYEFAACEREL